MHQSNIAHLKKNVAPFEKTDTKSSIRQLINTIGPLLLLWYGAYLSLSVSYWLTLPLTIIAAGFMIRTFIIFHDCCHQSFFASRTANDILGIITGVLTLCPYEQWKNAHSIHHATSGNLDKRGVGDIWIMTVDEYLAAPWWQKIAYRIYRNPFVMFGIGPIFVFVFQYRFNRKGARRRERLNNYLMNVLIVGTYGLMIWAIGWKAVLLIQGPIFYISGVMGIWLFYVQHQFEDSYFENEDQWSYVKAAVEGSSYYKLPKVLQWLTGNIGFHHVHHLSPKVPNYNLEKAHNETPPLQMATTITFANSLVALRFRLWDEQGKRFVSFKELKQMLTDKESIMNALHSPKPSLEGK
ncbi:fatty acid desaturase [Brevibacillus reuszeri]|uniref:Fatty acid desaturase n=1 Tax=Brevibacillus reuszeri TaxID=54915 RepID=A0A0K9Z0T8_9BACL|nr:fatty acid desaturase [Brevibacillus reuszeri]KNB74472.1 fatty acid desaturase [Brevibacillus reuszeri]MED1856395.1 fatty acid desaturase [Brevibacillus reuszeri]GED67910.1 fatty acid desaturase [Brevibacillus reuszeri]